MASITQDMRFRLSLIQYAERHGVSNAAKKYKTNRQYIYRWKNRYDGSWDSLRDRSRRPHSHPNQHTPEEIKLIQDMRRRNLYICIACQSADILHFPLKYSIIYRG